MGLEAAAGAGQTAASSYMPWLNAASTVLGAALSPSPAGPAISSASAYTNVDHSGWTVSTGKSQASAVGAFPWYVWAAAGIAAIWYFKGKK